MPDLGSGPSPTTSIVGGGIAGLLQGYMQQRNNNAAMAQKQQQQSNLQDYQNKQLANQAAQIKGQSDYQDAQIQNAQNTAGIAADKEGMRINPDSGALEAIPDFADPNSDSNKRVAAASKLAHPVLPGNQLATPGEQSAAEAAAGVDPGTFDGMISSQAKGMIDAGIMQGGANARNKNTTDQDAVRQQATIDAQKALKTGQYSVGQQAMDKDFGKKYDDYTSGDRDSAMASLEQLRNASAAFKKYSGSEDTGLIGTASRYYDMHAPGGELTDAVNQAQDAASGDLKAKFGGRVSNLDLMTGLRFTVNPKLSAADNAAQIDRKADTLEQRIKDRDAKADYFTGAAGNGPGQTLFGYKPNFKPTSGTQQTPAPAPAGGNQGQGQGPTTYSRDQMYSGIDSAAQADSASRLHITPNILAGVKDPSNPAANAAATADIKKQDAYTAKKKALGGGSVAGGNNSSEPMGFDDWVKAGRPKQ